MGAEKASPDARSHTVVFLCHCLLNQNAKVEPLATYPGVFPPLVRMLMDEGVGLIQLPCPEVAYPGVDRPLGSDTREQYDTLAYRRVCESMADDGVALMAAYERDGCRVACVLGVEGSPSCSVERVPVMDGTGARTTIPGSGLFVEALRSAMGRKGVSAPFLGVPETTEVGNLEDTLATVRGVLQP